MPNLFLFSLTTLTTLSTLLGCSINMTARFENNLLFLLMYILVSLISSSICSSLISSNSTISLSGGLSLKYFSTVRSNPNT